MSRLGPGPPRTARPRSLRLRTGGGSRRWPGVVTLLCGAGGFALASGLARRQLVPLAPAHRRADSRPRDPARRSLLVHRGRDALDRAVVARGADVRRARPRVRRVRDPLRRRPGRRVHRGVPLPGRVPRDATTGCARSRSPFPRSLCSFTVESERPLMFGLVLLPAGVHGGGAGSFLGRHPRIVIPMLMWLWVNVHGTFSLGFLYLAVYLAGRWLERRACRGGAANGICSSGPRSPRSSIFVNPYGAEPGVLPDRADGPQQGAQQRRRVAVGQPPHRDRRASTPSGSS